jgi:ABC-type polysaccharide/polyol phosphate transport system ATPase subunit
LSTAVLGLKPPEIAGLIPKVAEFTDLGEYLKLPIRCYSQGMMLRLAFGISTAIQPDIILLDEIIGVGDQAFSERARERLSNLIDAASILVLATPDPGIVTRLCTSAIWLSQGRVVASGSPAEILDRYSASLHAA